MPIAIGEHCKRVRKLAGPRARQFAVAPVFRRPLRAHLDGTVISVLRRGPIKSRTVDLYIGRGAELS